MNFTGVPLDSACGRLNGVDCKSILMSSARMYSERSFNDPTYFALLPHGFYPRRVSSGGFPHIHSLSTMKEFFKRLDAGVANAWCRTRW